MGIQSVSFWQQDRNYWSQAQSRSQSLASTDALISSMGSATTNLSSGLSSIANQEALARTNTALTAAIQSALQQTQSAGSNSSANSTGSSSSTSSNSSASSNSSNSSGSSSSAGSLATGTGTVPLTLSTPLSTLRIPPNSAITVSDGTNTTTYTTSGTDTVNDLIGAINTNAYGNAQVTASLNSSGNLVLTGKYNSDSITVGGTFASVIGFGAGNNQFSPAPASTSSGSATTSASSGASGLTTSTSNSTTGSSGNASSSSSSGIPNNSALALQTGGTAEFLLAANGLAGTLLNVLA